MLTISELVDASDICVQDKDNVKMILHQLGYHPEDAVGKAFWMIAKKDMTDAGMNVAHANALLAKTDNAVLADTESDQGDLLCVAHICDMWLICTVHMHCEPVGH